MATTLACMGHLKWYQQQYQEAMDYYQRAYQIRKKRLGDRHPATQKALKYIEDVNEALAKRSQDSKQ